MLGVGALGLRLAIPLAGMVAGRAEVHRLVASRRRRQSYPLNESKSLLGYPERHVSGVCSSVAPASAALLAYRRM